MPSTTPSVFQVFIQGTVESVWDELTRTDKRILALFNNRMEYRSLQSGSRMAMRTTGGKYTGMIDAILEVIPYQRFSHTFKFMNFDDPPCMVIFELESVEGGTQFSMSLEALPLGTKTAKQRLSGAK